MFDWAINITDKQNKTERLLLLIHTRFLLKTLKYIWSLYAPFRDVKSWWLCKMRVLMFFLIRKWINKRRRSRQNGCDFQLFFVRFTFVFSVRVYNNTFCWICSFSRILFTSLAKKKKKPIDDDKFTHDVDGTRQ